MATADFTEQELKTEIWKTIEDYPNYAVSDLGRVKRIVAGPTRPAGKLLNRCIIDGYLCVTLYNLRGRKMLKVHRLVAFAFLPRPDNSKTQINHKDHNRLNPRPENLEWCTAKENRDWCQRAGRHPRGESHGLSTRTEQDIIEIRHRIKTRTGSLKDLAQSLNINYATLLDIHQRRSWKHIP